MFLSNKKPVEVKRVGDTLVAVFRNSNPSLVWKFDLARNHSFTVALQGDEGDLELGVTSPKGEFYPIARFNAREDADLAFAAVQKVLMKRKCGWLGCLLKWAGGLVLLLLIALLIGIYLAGYRGPKIFSTGPASTAAPEIRNGVPLPADQVLRPPN
jgi:hypothetical protein